MLTRCAPFFVEPALSYSPPICPKRSVEILPTCQCWVPRLRGNARTVPIVVLTAKDLTPEERGRLNGDVECVLQKGACSREQLLDEMEALRAAVNFSE